jgi:hypothetical protein
MHGETVKFFISVLTTASHFCLSCVERFQTTNSRPVYLRRALVLYFRLRTHLPRDPFPSGFPTKIFADCCCPPPNVPYAAVFLILLCYMTQIIFDNFFFIIAPCILILSMSFIYQQMHFKSVIGSIKIYIKTCTKTAP